jgi:hypothetical protein
MYKTAGDQDLILFYPSFAKIIIALETSASVTPRISEAFKYSLVTIPLRPLNSNGFSFLNL